MKKVVYVAGPYTGPTHDGTSYHIISAHIWFAREYAKAIWELGAAAVCPHMNSAHFECDCKATAEDFYQGDLAILKNCDAIFMMPDWQKSKGAKLERDFAEARGIPVFYSMDVLRGWLARVEREAAMAQAMPQGEGADVAELVKADIKAHRTSADGIALAYYQLQCIAFFLKRQLANRKMVVSEIREEVSADIEARVKLGEKKYGTRLRTNNGRKALVDAFQEVLDALNYFRQEIEEQKDAVKGPERGPFC